MTSMTADAVTNILAVKNIHKTSVSRDSRSRGAITGKARDKTEGTKKATAMMTWGCAHAHVCSKALYKSSWLTASSRVIKNGALSSQAQMNQTQGRTTKGQRLSRKIWFQVMSRKLYLT